MRWHLKSGGELPGITEPSEPAGYPVKVALYLETPAELADFVARMNIVGDSSPDIATGLELAQEFDELPDPDDVIFDGFYAELYDFVEKFLEEESK